MEIKNYICNICRSSIEKNPDGTLKCLILDKQPDSHICFGCVDELRIFFRSGKEPA